MWYFQGYVWVKVTVCIILCLNVFVIFNGIYMYSMWVNYMYAGIILCMCAANERRRYIVTLFLIGCAHIQSDPCVWSSSPSRVSLPSISGADCVWIIERDHCWFSWMIGRGICYEREQTIVKTDPYLQISHALLNNIQSNVSKFRKMFLMMISVMSLNGVNTIIK